MNDHVNRDEEHALTPAARLVRSAIAILQTSGTHSLTVAQVLDQANASYVELFAEFEGIDGLVDAAQLAQVVSRHRAILDLMEDALRYASSYEEFIQGITRLTESVRDPTLKETRIIGTIVINNGVDSAALLEVLADRQHELSNRIAATIADGERKGLFRCVTSPRTVGVFIQAFTAGRILSELDRMQTPANEWVAVVDQAVRSLLLPITDEGDHP